MKVQNVFLASKTWVHHTSTVVTSVYISDTRRYLACQDGGVSVTAGQFMTALCVLRLYSVKICCHTAAEFCEIKTHHTKIRQSGFIDSLWTLDNSPGRPLVWLAIRRSPLKSVAKVRMPRTTVWKVLRKKLCFKSYKM